VGCTRSKRDGERNEGIYKNPGKGKGGGPENESRERDSVIFRGSGVYCTYSTVREAAPLKRGGGG
jgi:hypothetical protein